MTSSQSPQAASSVQSSVASFDPTASLKLLWKSLSWGLAGVTVVAAPLTQFSIAQAQTTGTSVKLLEPAGLAAVQTPSEPAPEVPAAAQVSSPEKLPVAVEPIAEQPDPVPPVRVIPIEKPVAKAEPTPVKVQPQAPQVIAAPEVMVESEEPSAEQVEGADQPEAVQWGPVSIDRQGVQFAPPAAFKPYFNGNLKLSKLPSLSSLGMMFPLAIPHQISSIFGWRVHPITGEQRMHTGTDLAAPMGTPVVAVLSGKVLLADFLGGYGMTVALEHGQGSQQTLYAHLSELFVQPGQVVEKGTVIGRVGSTGNSTGPHLHFEMRQQLPDGSWIAQDAGQQLEVAMAQLNQALKVAQNPKTIAPTQSLQTNANLPLNPPPQQIAQGQTQVISQYAPLPLKVQPIVVNPAKTKSAPKSDKMR